MKQYGTRRFYEMTDRYLSRIEKVTRDARAAFQDEAVTGVVKPYWLIRADLLYDRDTDPLRCVSDDYRDSSQCGEGVTPRLIHRLISKINGAIKTVGTNAYCLFTSMI